MNRLKLNLGFLFLLVVLFGASACQRTKDDTAEGRKEVSFLHYFSFAGPFAGTLHAIANDFNRADQNHALRITPINHESFKTIILEDLRQGKTADIYTYWAGARTQSIIEKLAPLDDALPPAEMNKLFGSSIVQSACTYNGRIYLLPVTQHYVGFFYNKKIFTDNGLTPPQTWDDFILLGKKLKARGITPIALGSKAKWPAQFWFDYLLLRTAPLDYRQKLMAGKAAFTDPQVVHVFSLWRDLVKSGMFNNNPNQSEFDSGAGMMVKNGEAAMTLMGTWMMGYYSSIGINWQEDSDYGFFSFPTMDSAIPTVALGPIDGLIVPKNAQNIAGAKAVLQHFSLPGAQDAISRGTGALAPNRQVSEQRYTPMKLAIRADIARANAWAFNYDLATPPERAEIGLNLFAEFLDNPDQYLTLLKKADSLMQQLPAAPHTPSP